MGKGSRERAARRARRAACGRPVMCECCGAEPATVDVRGGVRTYDGGAEGELSLSGRTLEALMARPDQGAELFALHDRADVVAWLDAHGLAYRIVPPDETPQEKLARLLSTL